MRAGEGEAGTDEVREAPHERDDPATDEDERGPRPSHRRVAQQAQRDIEHGLEDTDCRSDHGEDSACPPRPKMPSS